jgi:hypothetical protein
MSPDAPHPVGDAALGGAVIVVLGYLAVTLSAPQPVAAFDRSAPPRLATALADQIGGQPPQ